MKRTKSVKVSRKYQITIPKNIREIAGIDKMEGVYFESWTDTYAGISKGIFSVDFIKKERSHW
jgi:bifunctional DNA-binding transcriptional regulator/antitoxin component of YhaV-PrlF toxin-antitoxin module